MKEQKEISLLDMCFHILSKWKLMIIAAFIGAVLMGTVSYLKSYKEYKDSQLVEEVDPMSQINLTEEEITELEAKIAVIKEYEESIEEYDYYLENSIKVKMNSNKFYQGSLVYFIEAEEIGNVTKAKAYFKEEIFKESNYEELALLLSEQTDATLIKEVVYVGEKINPVEKDVLLLQDDENETFSIFVEHYVQDECEVMLKYFNEQMENAEAVLASKGVFVNVKKISSDIKTCSDCSLVELGTSIKTKRSVAYDNINAIEEQMTEAQKAYYSFVYSEDATNVEDTATTNTIQSAEISIKLMSVGSIMGVFLVVCLYGVFYIFSNRVHTKEEMESWLSLPIYEYETDLKEKDNLVNTVLNAFEKKLIGKSVETPEMIAQMLVNSAKQADAQKIYFTGSLGSLKSNVIESIMAKMTTESLEVIKGNNIINDVKALQRARDCGYVVFMEKCNESLEKDIRSEVAKAHTCGIKILGVILEA